MQRRITSWLLTIFSALMLTLSSHAFAATTATGSNGQRVSPVRSDLTINPGTAQTVAITVQNVTSNSVTLQAIVNDFVAGDGENGEPKLILRPTDSPPQSSLKKFVQPIPNFTLAAGASTTVKVTVSIPNGTAGGGYYGAVRFAAASNGSNSNNVNLTASVGSLILVRVPGDIKENLSIASFDARTSSQGDSGRWLFTSNKSIYAVTRFDNKGNVQEQPFGKINVLKGKKTVQTLEINTSEPKSNALPGGIRRFSVQLKGLSSFGKYTIQGNFGYGSNGQLLSASSTFYVIPLALIILIGILIVLLVIGIFTVPRAIKRYNARVLRRAGRR